VGGKMMKLVYRTPSNKVICVGAWDYKESFDNQNNIKVNNPLPKNALVYEEEVFELSDGMLWPKSDIKVQINVYPCNAV
jgi:hypothetical protein